MKESDFKKEVANEIKKMLPGCIIAHLNPTEIQGIPDLLILHNNKWATLEGKKSAKEHHQPNQDHYVEKMNDMSFSRFIYPENKEEVLDDLQRTLRA